ncbi:hypothetical protein RJT34_22857 [Clitoria ternatea]|uniref:Myb-like domain-containing protein n=1 Tax=Clitoria ternatea TaxID=43366 RepID=A0AAN9IGN8_CLITE
MFDGVPDQFHQFITPPPRTSSSLPLHLPFPLQPPNTTFPSSFDPYNNNNNPHHHHQLPLQPNLLHHPSSTQKHEQKQESTTIPMNFEIQRDQRQQLPELVDPWTNDEVLALLRIRSSMETWFPELTWEHVSRKLAEVGYKRSAEKCKEKFEEESRYFNNNINFAKSNNNNYRLFSSELEQLYQHQGGTHQEVVAEEKSEQKQDKNMVHAMEETTTTKERKRKREDRFELLKGFCESIVHKMMAQQEEMHNKLIEDMMKRDEEKFSREEAWKKQEMDKMNKELELMAREQAIAGDRQANIIEILNNFSTSKNSPVSISQNPSNNNPNASPTQNPSSTLAQDTLQVIPPCTTSAQLTHNNPLEISSSGLNKSSSNVSSTNEKDDVGRRWPKDEVLALINLRCTTSVNNNSEENKEGNNKAPLWERISQGMCELGYKRSAKRCKEKWENINKYFRKTKDNANRKRSLESRTCPYFHLLSNLYNQGKLVLHNSERSDQSHLNNVVINQPVNNEDQITQADDDESNSNSHRVGYHDQGEKTLMQVQLPSLDFDDQF